MTRILATFAPIGWPRAIASTFTQAASLDHALGHTPAPMAVGQHSCNANAQPTPTTWSCALSANSFLQCSYLCTMKKSYCLEGSNDHQWIEVEP